MKLETGTDVICKVTGETGHIFNIIPGTKPLYEVLWDKSMKASREPRENLIPQYKTLRP